MRISLRDFHLSSYGMCPGGGGGGGTLYIIGWRCAAGTLKPLLYTTRPCLAAFYNPILD